MLSLKKIFKKLLFEQKNTGKGWFNFRTKKYIDIGNDLHLNFAKNNLKLFNLDAQPEFIYDVLDENNWIAVNWDQMSFGYRFYNENSEHIPAIQEFVQQNNLKPKSFYVDGMDSPRQKNYSIPYADFMAADSYKDFRSYRI